MTLYEKIKETAKLRGLSLQTVAERSGLSTNMIYQYKTVKPKLGTLKLIADTLNVSVDYLLGNTDEMTPNKKGPSAEPERIDLDAALEDKGVVMRFQGKDLSDKAKRGILDIIKLVDGDED
ncbi:helix-turn-helix domain-containing protein [Weissella kandleri]|uniref:helix-turn-helix domain-containing protein n=1 Tax=Weissella kandleri TaxID=1616 RepID=UPI00387E4040